MLHPRVEIALIAATCALAIVAYGMYRCQNSGYADPLTMPWAPPPLDSFLDGWGLSHFLFFFAVAYMHPSEYVFIWSLGLGWELIEFASKDHPFYLSDCNITTDKGTGWWYGRWEDVVMNTAGIALALHLRSSLVRVQ